MESATTRTSKWRRDLTSAAMTLVIATLASGVPTASAEAQDRDRDRGREYHHHHGGHDHWRYRDRDRYELRSYGPPAYVYSPPPVYYYAPPPGPPVIDFVFPLRFR